MAAHSKSSSTVEKRHEAAFQAISSDARMATQHGSTYSGANRTQDGNIIQVNSINAHSVQIGTSKQSVDDLGWLYAPPYDSKHKKTKRERVEGSGAWLFERNEYQRWYHDTGLGRLLWCHGKPGAGKTFITSAVIDELLANQNERNIAIAYIYLDYADREAQTLENLFASMLKQVSLRKKEAIAEVHRACGKGTQQLDADALVEALARMSQHFEKIFIVIDALDECSDKLRTMILKQLQSLDNPKWRFFLTGRSHLLDIPTRFPSCLQVTIFAHRDDVEKLVRDRIHDDAGLAELFEENQFLEDKTVAKIAEKANGMFLLVTLILNSIASSTCENDIEESLDQMPADLNQSYEKTLERIKDQDPRKVELSYRILWWLSRARRPLSCEELPHAVAVRDGDRGRNPKKESRRGIMTTVCMGLVFVDDAENFRLVHFSTQEYLQAHLSLLNVTKILREDEIIAKACLTILLYDEFEDGPCATVSGLKTRCEKHPMLQYAAQYWHEHLGEIMSEKLDGLALDFFHSSRKVRATTQIQEHFQLETFPPTRSELDHPMPWWIPLSQGSKLPQYTLTTGLHVACKFGVFQYVRQLLQEPEIDINMSTDNLETPLTLAIRNDHAKIVELLLRAEKIDYEHEDVYQETPFFIAARGNNTEIMKQLLAKGVSVQARDGQQRNALHMAAISRKDSAEMVELLIASGVEINARGEQEETPLQLAVITASRRVVRVLLSRGADVSATNKKGRTPLHYAVGTRLSIAQALHQAGADIHIRDSSRKSTLVFAAASGQIKMVKWLLSLGADASAADDTGWTPLHYAAKRDLSTAQALHQAGADVHACTKNGEIALSLAMERDRSDIVEWLLSLDTKRPKRDEHLLNVAATVGALRTVKLLLDRGVNYNANHQFSLEIFRKACRTGNVPVQLLLDDRAFVGQYGRSNTFSLFAIAYRGSIKILRLLVERNAACVDLVDELGRNALHFAAKGGHVECFEFLLSKGLDLNSADIKGNTILHYAAIGGSFPMVKSLLDHDMISLPRASNTWSPLHWAYRTGCDRNAVELLEAVYSKEDVVETVEPAGLWTPLSIGPYHREDLFGEILQYSSIFWDLLPGILSTEKSMVTDKAGKWHGGHSCKECFLHIHGPRFHCISCIDFDVCFMCKLTVANSHPAHQWKVFEWRRGKSVEVESAEL